MLYTTIDVLRPAKVSFPVDVNHLLIVNNAASQPKTYGHKTIQFNENQKSATVDTDSLPVFALASFAESILEKNFSALSIWNINPLIRAIFSQLHCRKQQN